MKIATVILMLGSCLVWILWDTHLSQIGAETESRIIANFSARWVSVAFVIGIIIGHWLLHRTHVESSNWRNTIPLLVLVLLFDLIWNGFGIKEPHFTRYSGLWLALGTATGSWLWGQIV